MAIVMISSLFQGGREELAGGLAQKTGWPVLSREDMLEAARDVGIRIGRLETSFIKSPGGSERLAREKDLYLAFVTARICEKALEGNLIYHGRAAHLLLPGVTSRVRVGLTAPWHVRVERTARQLRISPEKAESYLLQLDEDIDKWIRHIHQADGRDPRYYDLFVNLENIGLADVVVMLRQMADLRDFKSNPESDRLLHDLYLASQSKVILAQDPRTADAELNTQAENGFLTVTYTPQQEQVSRHIIEVLSGLEGCRKIECTMAETSILWVQERFSPDSDNFQHIMQLSQRWGAAVELLRLIPPGESVPEEGADNLAPFTAQCVRPTDESYDGGVEEDGPEAADDGGLHRTREELVNLGRSGGAHSVCGGYEKILQVAQGSGHYNLVVIGDMFLSKGRSTRTRQTRELTMSIRDRLKAPVITAEDLKAKFLFGPAQALKLAGYALIVLLVYILVFTQQDTVLNFLGGEMHQQWKYLSSATLLFFVPAVAYLYGAVAGLALKIINID